MEGKHRIANTKKKAGLTQNSKEMFLGGGWNLEWVTFIHIRMNVYVIYVIVLTSLWMPNEN